MGTIFLVPVFLVGFYRTILTLSMRAFGPRISAYAFWTTTDIPREISIEHPSVGLASLAQSREISVEHPKCGARFARPINFDYTL